jgi:hypothetical protein
MGSVASVYAGGRRHLDEMPAKSIDALDEQGEVVNETFFGRPLT